MTLRERRRAERRFAAELVRAPSHLEDQAQASHVEAKPIMEGIAGSIPNARRFSSPPDEKARLAFAALHLAGRDRVNRWCPHARGDQIRPQVVDLSNRFAYCDECGPTSVLRTLSDGTVVIVNDGRCDICSHKPPGNYFTPFAIEFGDGMVFMGEVGPCCSDIVLSPEAVS
jgi:hypothetical protein